VKAAQFDLVSAVEFYCSAIYVRWVQLWEFCRW